MIAVQTVIDFIESTLESEGSGRWEFEADYKPALNRAIDFTTSLFKQAIAVNAISERTLSELIFIRIYRTSEYSRLVFDGGDASHILWDVLSVKPEAVVGWGEDGDPGASENTIESELYETAIFISSQYSAKRVDSERWEVNVNNRFYHGSTINFKSYSYRSFVNYRIRSVEEGTPFYPTEIEVRPALNQGLVALEYLKVPNKVVTEDDSVEFPELLTTLFSEITMGFLLEKDGGTFLTQMTDKTSKELISLFK